ncbi:MAG: argininosuccinate synthase [Clostridia bacterium]
MKKVVLAYSGGLDTSVAIDWLRENYGLGVIALAADVGEGKDLDAVKQKAIDVGALDCHVVDVREEFARDYAFAALKANALYEDRYPLSSALSRPLIAKLLVECAEAEGAVAVAHGCTGKGNDQVRFDVSVKALNPDLRVVAPVREWPMSREQEISYARERDIPVPVGEENPFSIDVNLWGRSIECGVLEDPWVEAPEEAFEWTRPPGMTPDEAAYVTIEFVKGVPVALDGEKMSPAALISRLNEIGGAHGVGRLDHVENRLVGIKSREIYEAPAASILLEAHRDLEDLTLPRELAHFKKTMEPKYAELVYFGLWFSPLRGALDAFVDSSQDRVTGTVRLRLHHGSCRAVGRKSPNSLYDLSLATYGGDDSFDHRAAEGFISVWGLPTVVHSSVGKRISKEKDFGEAVN